MIEFGIHDKRYDSVIYIYGERDEIFTDPPYQRMSDIWTIDKRQLLIDSILNGFDIPKLYFHELVPPIRTKKDGILRYAIIDGKQRLEAIWGFIDGRFALSSDFEYLRDSDVKAGGMSYKDLAHSYPKLKGQFDANPLPVVLVQTDDIELIEEMFSRLNEAVPLNAPEKRNALGGPMPGAIRKVAKMDFFDTNLPYGNARYRHYDLATKFLYIEYVDGIKDTKKVYLDEFVREFKKRPRLQVRPLISRVRRVLRSMTKIFLNSDSLISSVGTSVLYYLLFREALAGGWSDDITRTKLDGFERSRMRNRQVATEDIAKAIYELLEYDRYSQSPNDAAAIEYRYRVLRQYIGPSKKRGRSAKATA